MEEKKYTGRRKPFAKASFPVRPKFKDLDEKQKLKIIPLGGVEEVGLNMTVFEYENDIVIIDMGLQFPEENMPGIDYIIPNISYLKGKEKNIRAVIFSHSHLDHIGAAPILLRELNYPPIVGRDLTLSMVKHRLEDQEKNSSKRLKTVQINKLTDSFNFGSFAASFFQVEHSTIDSAGIILKTPVGTVIHPGDWTMSRDSNGKSRIDYLDLSRLPRPTILMLESLGSIDVRPSATSEEMRANLEKLIVEAKGRTIIGTFSSQIERVSWIFEIAARHGKKVALDGYSMKMSVEIAKELGYIKIPKETLIKVNQLDKYPDDRVVVLCTGSQGEGNAVLSRIISGGHKFIKLKKPDTVILSSSIIPGNERTIQRLKDSLYRQCDNVIHGSIMDIHVSGHGNREDIVQMLATIKPDYYIPVYANHYMLKEGAKLAMENKFNKDKIFVPDNGQIIEVTKDGARLTNKKVPTNYVMVDGLGVGDVGQVVLRDRQAMAQDGMFVIVVQVDKQTGLVKASPDIISRGFIYMRESKGLLFEARNKVRDIVKESTGSGKSVDPDYIKNNIRDQIGQFLFQKTERRPMVLPVVIEV